MDIIQGLIVSGNVGKSGLRIVNTNGTFDVAVNTAAPTLPTEIVASDTIPTGIISGTTDRYISFPYSGTAATKDYTFTTTESIVCDILIVGGGGAGSGTIGGGGGGGALIFARNATLNGTYTVNVGNGGIGGSTGQGTKGNSSRILQGGINITAEGGGASGRADGNQNGGSGGGGDFYDGNQTRGISTSYTSTAFGASIVKYGNNGANAYTSSPFNGGGGGGAGSSALIATSTNLFSNGGSGLHQVIIDGITINFASYFGTNTADVGGVLFNGNLYYGGGGAGGGNETSLGGTGGIGGGGDGGRGSSGSTPPYIPIHGSNGLPKTGGGGGGGSNHPSLGGNGGSGIVIIRYRKASNISTGNTLFTILNGGNILVGSNLYSNLITNYIDTPAATGISSQWTSNVGTSGKIYYNTSNIDSNVGIGTIDPVVPLHIYNNNATTRLLLDTTTTAPATLEFRRGTGADIQNDYRFINDTDGAIKLQIQNTTQIFGNTDANLALFSSNETIIYKNTAMNGRVGIGTTYNSTRNLDVVGDANISGMVSVGGLSVSGSGGSVSATISNSLTNNTSLTIQNGYVVPVITSSPVATTTGITGAYTYQVFTYTTETGGAGSGQSLYTFNVASNPVNCDILVVGGGGGGGDGGGGGGGYVYTSNINIPVGSYSIRVGKGGNGGVAYTQGSQGSSSSFIVGGTTYIAYGGGGGGGTGAIAPPHTAGQVGSYGGNGANNSGNVWTLVRRVPAGNAWHPTTDGLVGNVVYGTYSSNPQNNNIGTGWSINFENAVPGYDQFKFATGDNVVWLITTKAAVGGAVVSPAQYYADSLRAIISSSDSATPYSARWYYRSVGTEDPWISVIDHAAATGAGKILYGGNSFASAPHINVLSQRIGANVFIRNSNSPITSPAVQIYTSSQGNRGGNAVVSSYGSGGGGGGAGAVGGDANFASPSIIAGGGLQYYRGGTGGDGVLNTITGGNIYYAGGGTGGANTNQGTDTTTQIAPVGGGGIGSRAPGGIGGNGVDGTGGGGGGGDPDRTSASGRGGHGIVIIRYLTPLITSSSIDLIRGTAADANRDYKIGNYNSEFKVISSTSGVDTDYIKITTAGAITNPTGTASWNTGSDRRIKENIERASYDKCYENINKLELNRFNYVEGFNTVSRDNKQLGFIAQEVYDIFPKAISSHGYYSDTLSIPDLLSIDISQINYSLYGAVKKLIEINEEDEKHLNSFNNRIKTIKTILNIAMELTTSNILDTSNLLDTTSNVILDTSNVILDTSNVILDTSNLIDTSSNVIMDTSNLIDTSSNVIMDTSNLIDTSSNVILDTSNVIDTSSNVIMDT
jgi:hypothetical protein